MHARSLASLPRMCTAVVNAVYARAVRNCPWVGPLWARALRALERCGAGEERHAALYREALAAGLQVGAGLGRRGSMSAKMPSNLTDSYAAAAASTSSQSYEDYLEVMLARLDCLRRRCGGGAGGDGDAAAPVEALRSAFRQASELLQSYFPDHLDRSFRCVMCRVCTLVPARPWEAREGGWRASGNAALLVRRSHHWQRRFDPATFRPHLAG